MTRKNRMHLAPLPRLVASLFAGLFVSCSAEIEWPSAIPEGGVSDPKLRAEATAALEELEAAPTDEQRIIWFGRRIAYLGLHEEAIAIFTKGLKIHPESARLLRHRGHRQISLRRFDAAVTDFERAAALIQGGEDEVEPDGRPNSRNIPTSTLHTNIWYHLGLARYCRSEFADAVRCYEKCLAAAKNPDMEAATRYWLFLAATRNEDAERAKGALAPVKADWDIIENHAYHQLLLLYRGDRDRGAMKTPSGDAIQGQTLAYGLARHHFIEGDAEAGTKALNEIVANRSAAFGCIAAEADLRQGTKR